MNKLTALLLCFCIAIPAAYGACAAQGAYDALGLGTLQTAGTVTNPSSTYCTGTATANSCVTLANLNLLKSKSDAIQSDLETSFGNRDKALLEARKNLRALEGNYTVLRVALNSSKTNVNSWASDATYGTAATKVKNFIADYEDFFDKVFLGYNGIQTSFDTYQTSRQTCMNKLLELTVNAKCFASMEGNSADVSTNGVAVDNTVNAALLTACWGFVNQSDYQNNIFQLNPYNGTITALTSAAIQIANGTKDAVNTFVTSLTSVANAAKTYPAAVIPPSSCSATACDWITTNFFSGALTGNAATKAAILAGGSGYTYISRILPESRSRGLTMAATAPSAGVTISFAKNPGNVVNSVDPSGLSAFRVGVISSLVALFVAFLF